MDIDYHGIRGFRIGNVFLCSACVTQADLQTDSQQIVTLFQADNWLEGPDEICVRCGRVMSVTQTQDNEDLNDKLNRIAFLKRFSD